VERPGAGHGRQSIDHAYTQDEKPEKRGQTSVSLPDWHAAQYIAAGYSPQERRWMGTLSAAQQADEFHEVGINMSHCGVVRIARAGEEGFSLGRAGAVVVQHQVPDRDQTYKIVPGADRQVAKSELLHHEQAIFDCLFRRDRSWVGRHYL